MLKAYRDASAAFVDTAATDIPDGVIWIDLLDPTADEIALVERRVGVKIPTADALSEIEASSRLSVEHGIIYLSTPVVARGQTADPVLSPAGFILSPKLLVTVRFTELPTFDIVAERVRQDDELRCSIGVFTALVEAIVDRGADVLEHLGRDLDAISRSIFRGDPSRARHPVRSSQAMRGTLTSVGRIGDRLSQVRDVLLGIGRINGFVLEVCHHPIEDEFRARLGAVGKDVVSLNDYESQLSNKVQFLLDASLGFINIEQNDLFKILTIASVVGIAPTLIAGIYGMNFKNMPELNWDWGYPIGIAVIVLSAVAPLLWFKWRGWF